MNSQPQSFLLDKGIVRRIYEYQVRLEKNLPPTPFQTEAAKILTRLTSHKFPIYITRESANVLQLRPIRFVRPILTETSVLYKARYLRRWARRLRAFAFTREDAVIISYGSFGASQAEKKVGVQYLVTGDFAMVTNFAACQADIQARFTPMVTQLPTPYRHVSLPQLLTPADLLAHW